MMIHIYKVYRAAAGTLLLTAALAACTDDSREPMQENETPREGIFFSVTATQGEGAETRVEYQLNGDQGMDVKWAANDKIYVGKTAGVYGYINNVLSPLDIVAGGVGQTTAQFDGTVADNHLPANGAILHAFYGKIDKIQVDYGNIRYDYTGQRQTANGNMTHAAEYDFMTASTEYIPGSNHHFSFSHAGSMMQFTLYGLEDQTVKKLTLSTYDGSKVFGYSPSVSLDLGVDSSNGISLGSSETLKAYLMMAPNTKTAGKEFVLYVTTIDGKNFAALLTGAEIAAGKLYTVDAPLTEYGFELFQGAGTSGDPYKINGAGDLTKLAVMTNTGMIKTSEKYFELTADIDMKTGGGAWVPIGVSNNAFEGTFLGEKGSGGNHSISNLPGKTADDFAGLFGYAKGATIKNVTVSGEITISGASGNDIVCAGGIAGQAGNSIIENCLSTCTINISAFSAYAGGIIGNSGGGNEVTECKNQGAVNSSENSGGIISYARNDQITRCTNNGAITSTSTEYPAGGIIGNLYLQGTNQNFTLTGCSHTGDNPTQGAAGSIIGSYSIGKRYSGNDPFSTITIKDADGQTLYEVTGNANQAVEGQWPEAAQ